MRDSRCDEPTPSPEADLEKLHYDYVADLESLRLSYIDTVAKRVTNWFFANYEDPAESTPHDEGDYVYIWGGPYDTREIIDDALSSIVPDELIEEIIEATVGEIDEQGCGGDVCVPLFGRYDPADDLLASISE